VLGFRRDLVAFVGEDHGIDVVDENRRASRRVTFDEAGPRCCVAGLPLLDDDVTSNRKVSGGIGAMWGINGAVIGDAP